MARAMRARRARVGSRRYSHSPLTANSVTLPATQVDGRINSKLSAFGKGSETNQISFAGMSCVSAVRAIVADEPQDRYGNSLANVKSIASAVDIVPAATIKVRHLTV